MNNNNNSGALLKTIILVILISAFPIVPLFIQFAFLGCICILIGQLIYGLIQENENKVQLSYKKTGKKYFNESDYNKALYYYNKVPEKFRDSDWTNSVTLIKYGIELSNQYKSGKSYEQSKDYNQALKLYIQILKELYANNIDNYFPKIKSNILNIISSLCISTVNINNEKYTKIMKNQLSSIGNKINNDQHGSEIIETLSKVFNVESNSDNPLNLLEENYKNVVEKGNQGEDLIYENTQNLQNVYKILRNVNIRFNYKTEKWDPNSSNGNQMDEVIIGKKGIFILEIKNWTGKKVNYSKYNQIMLTTNSNNIYREEFAETQIKNHKKALTSLLNDNGVSLENKPYKICCWLTIANPEINIKDSTITIYNSINIGDKIENYMYKNKDIPEKELENIYEIISNNQINESPYDHYIFNQEYFSYLIQAVNIINS